MKSDRKHIDVLPTIPTLARYDQEMFDFHNKIEALEEQVDFRVEKVQKEKFLEGYATIVKESKDKSLATGEKLSGPRQREQPSHGIAKRKE